MIAAVLLGPLFGAAAQEPEAGPYTDHKYVHVTAFSLDEIRALEQVGNILSCRYAPGIQPMIIAPERVGALDMLGLAYVVVEENVQEIVDAQRRLNDIARSQRNAAPRRLVCAAVDVSVTLSLCGGHTHV